MSPRPSGCDFSFSTDESPFFPHLPPFHCFVRRRAARAKTFHGNVRAVLLKIYLYPPRYLSWAGNHSPWYICTPVINEGFFANPIHEDFTWPQRCSRWQLNRKGSIWASTSSILTGGKKKILSEFRPSFDFIWIRLTRERQLAGIRDGGSGKGLTALLGGGWCPKGVFRNQGKMEENRYSLVAGKSRVERAERGRRGAQRLRGLKEGDSCALTDVHTRTPSHARPSV